MQLPPAFSALKRGGEPLYEKARRGENVSALLEKRPTTVYSLELDGFGRESDAPRLFAPPSMPTGPPRMTAGGQPGDWRCGVCDIQNFARRESCFKCKKPKAEVEAEAAAETEDADEAGEVPDDPNVKAFGLNMNVKGGFYVRSLIRDIGRSCGTVAHMRSLSRTRQGDFTLDNSLEEGEWSPEGLWGSATEV